MINQVQKGLNKVTTFLPKYHKKKRRDHELFKKLKYVEKNEIKPFKEDERHINKIMEFNKSFLGGYNSTDWNMLISLINGKKSEKYIPEDIWINHIVPRLNNVSQMPAFEDKSNFDLFFGDLNRPKTHLRYLNGKFYNSNYSYLTRDQAKEQLYSQENSLLVKPAWRGSGRGRQVKVFKPSNFENLFKYIVEKNVNGSLESAYLVQEYIEQHEVLSKIYPHSLNTIRVMTCRVEGEVKHLSSRLRMGRKGNVVDQGYFVGIKEDGVLNEFALDFEFNKRLKHEDTGIIFSNIRIPFYSSVVELCKQGHERLLRFDVVAWDIAIDRSGLPVFIEMNLSAPDITYMQMANGPLFGEYTEKILGKMDINLHFNI